MGKLYETPIKAIRKKCLDCSYWSPKEVRTCTVINIALSIPTVLAVGQTRQQ